MAGKPAQARAALDAFLKTPELKRPTVVAVPPASEAGDVGFLVPSFAEGSVILKDVKGTFYRLVWDRSSTDASVADQRRALPPGEYVVANYRLARRDARGAEWFISGSAARIQKVNVRSGSVQKIELDDAIRLTCRGMAVKDQIVVSLGVAGESRCGLSIFRDGERIPFRFRLTNAKGKALATGPLAYG